MWLLRDLSWKVLFCNFQSFQVANYINGGHYSPHHDYIQKEKDSSFVSNFFVRYIWYNIFKSNLSLSDDLQRRVHFCWGPYCDVDVLRKLCCKSCMYCNCQRPFVAFFCKSERVKSGKMQTFKVTILMLLKVKKKVVQGVPAFLTFPPFCFMHEG